MLEKIKLEKLCKKNFVQHMCRICDSIPLVGYNLSKFIEKVARPVPSFEIFEIGFVCFTSFVLMDYIGVLFI